MGGEDDEEDYGALIYRESQLRKAEAAAFTAAAAKAASVDVSSTRRRATSTRATSAGDGKSRLSVNAVKRARVYSKRKRGSSTEDEEQTPRKAARKQCRKKCSANGCTNIVVKGGVCIKHGTTVKRCSAEGCTNQAQKGGKCMKHGADIKRCSAEGCTSFAHKGGVCMKRGAERKRCSSEGCTNIAVKGGVTAIPLMNLQLSHRVSDQNLIRLLCLILIMVRQQAKGVYLKRLPSV